MAAEHWEEISLTRGDGENDIMPQKAELASKENGGVDYEVYSALPQIQG